MLDLGGPSEQIQQLLPQANRDWGLVWSAVMIGFDARKNVLFRASHSGRHTRVIQNMDDQRAGSGGDPTRFRSRLDALAIINGTPVGQFGSTNPRRNLICIIVIASVEYEENLYA